MDIGILFEKGKVWTISNFLSILRLFMGFVLYFFIIDKNTTGAIIVVILAIASDYADGYFARRRSEISELGKVLDPFADKVAVALCGIALNIAYGLPLWVVLVIIFRDILILFGSLILLGKVHMVVASEMPGKIAVTVISLLLLSYLFEFEPVQPPLLFLTAVAVVFSFLYYIWKFVKILTTGI